MPRLGKRLGSIERIDEHIAKKIAHAEELNKIDPEVYRDVWLLGIKKGWEDMRPQLIEHLQDKD